MRVIAIKKGYHNRKIDVGESFDYPESLMKRVKVDAEGNIVYDKQGAMVRDDENGMRILPTWVVKDTDENRSMLADAERMEVMRGRDAAIAASGPKRSKRGFASAVEEDVLADRLPRQSRSLSPNDLV